MATHIAFHEVDDVDHWLSSSKRGDVFGPLGITMRAFRGPAGSNRVGLIAEIPDMAPFQEFMQTEAAADAMKADGVRPETLLILNEGQRSAAVNGPAPTSGSSRAKRSREYELPVGQLRAQRQRIATHTRSQPPRPNPQRSGHRVSVTRLGVKQARSAAAADDCFARPTAPRLTSAMATLHSSRSGSAHAAARYRVRPDASVCGLGSARVLLFSVPAWAGLSQRRPNASPGQRGVSCGPRGQQASAGVEVEMSTAP